MLRLRRSKTFPVEYDPWRRLYAAMVVIAARDVSNRSTPVAHKQTAREFLDSNAQFIADEFEVPLSRIKAFMMN